MYYSDYRMDTTRFLWSIVYPVCPAFWISTPEQAGMQLLRANFVASIPATSLWMRFGPTMTGVTVGRIPTLDWYIYILIYYTYISCWWTVNRRQYITRSQSQVWDDACWIVVCNLKHMVSIFDFMRVIWQLNMVSHDILSQKYQMKTMAPSYPWSPRKSKPCLSLRMALVVAVLGGSRQSPSWRRFDTGGVPRCPWRRGPTPEGRSGSGVGVWQECRPRSSPPWGVLAQVWLGFWELWIAQMCQGLSRKLLLVVACRFCLPPLFATVEVWLPFLHC